MPLDLPPPPPAYVQPAFPAAQRTASAPAQQTPAEPVADRTRRRYRYLVFTGRPSSPPKIFGQTDACRRLVRKNRIRAARQS